MSGLYPNWHNQLNRFIINSFLGHNTGELSKSDISVFFSNKEEGEGKWNLSSPMANFVEYLDDMLIVFDCRGNLIYSNSSVSKILGYGFPDIKDLGWWFKVFKNKDVGMIAMSSFVNSFQKMKSDIVSGQCYERKIVSSNGLVKWISWKYIKYNKQSIICFGKDITYRKELEYEVRNYKRRLSSKHKELDNFVYKASHDLKGPVASILGITNIAKESVKNSSVIHYFNLIAKSSNKLNSILVDLMKISQISQEEPLIKPVDLKDFIVQVIESVKKETKEDFEIGYSLNIERLFFSDQKMLNAIFYNLIENGVKFKKHISNPYVKIEIDEVHGGIKILIEDNGVGIPEKFKHRVFEMFFRGHEYAEGTGLGLHIVKTAVEKLEGYVNIVKTSKKGTLISIFLPNLV